MSTMYVYVVAKNGMVYSAHSTMEAAKEKVAQIVAGGWYEYGGDEVLNVDKAQWTISQQTLEQD